MFLHFSGISLIVHLLIIFSAWIVSFVRHDNTNSAFQTYNKNGGLVKSARLNTVISIAVIFSVVSYMMFLFFIAVSTSIEMGSTEPQIIFAKWLIGVVFAGIVFTLSYSLFQMFALSLLTAAGAVYLYMKRLVLINRINNIDLKSLFTSLQLNKMVFVRSYVTHFSSLLTLNFFVSKLFPIIVVSTMVLLTFLTPQQVLAQIVEPGFESEVVAGGFSLATAAAFLPDGRIFVAEKSGTVKVVKDGVLLTEPLVILTDVNTFGDRGLIGMAIDPNFATNGYIYFSYTYENSPGANISGSKTARVVRLTVVGDKASESTKLVIIGTVGGTFSSPSCEDYAVTADCVASDSNSHSAGGLKFGPDGKLYATFGDGADFSTEDPRALRSQNVDSLAGKMLRINTDGTAPADNPFFNGDVNANRSKVYALGLRNTFRFSFNSETGKLYGGDVGWSDWEEVNVISSGANYGWPCREGNVATSYSCTPSTPASNPIYTYPHNEYGAGSITAGAFFSNNAYPASFATSFFIGDYAQMWIKRVVLDNADNVVSVEDFINTAWPVDIMTGLDGNVYYVDIVTGNLVRITHTNGNRRPVVSISATPTSGLIPLVVNFSSAGTMDPDGDALSYLWTFGDNATSSLPNPSHTYTTNGSYLASLLVTDSLGASFAKNLTITVGDQAPEAKITDPTAGSFYRALENVTVTGTGTDPEDGVLPNSAFSWTVLLHHNIHTHTVQQFTGTKNITFVSDDHADPDVYMEIILTVTDSAGLTSSKSINMYLDNGVAGGNLVANPSLEIADVLPNTPKDWIQSWYGVIDPTFTYPVAGLSGEKAANVTVTSQTSGNAKWYFTPAFVSPGEQYHFSNLYKANTVTYLTAQYGRVDGTYFYIQLAELPAVADPTTTSVTFTVPPEVQTITIFHEIASVGSLTVDEYSLTLVATNSDTIAPVGNIANLSNGATVSGTTTVEVNATDNVGVTSVHLLVDGVEVPGAEDLTAPYSFSLNTNNFINGNHTLSAHIHDVSGNFGTAADVTININNGTSTGPVNLIFNGDFEQVDGFGNPLGWTPGGWGTHTRVHTYPVPGFGGGSAAQVTITKYDFADDGDSKWAFPDVAVTPGTQYRYQSKYKAGSISDVIGKYTFSDGSYHYFGLIKEIPGTTVWTDISGTFIPPVGATSVTFYHLISSVTSLTIDDVAMFAVSTGTPAEINPPVVNVTAPANGSTVNGSITLRATATDDTNVVGVYFAINGAPYGAEDTVAPYEINWDTTTRPNGVYVIKATAHDPYGNNAKSEITITVDNTTVTPPPTGNNLILNPNLETVGAGGNPASWARGGWGTNDRTFTYPVTGVTGNAAKVAITTFTNGDAKWYFNDVSVLPNTVYTIKDAYMSNRVSETLVRYTLSGGGTQYQFLKSLPSTGGVWQTTSETITTPANATSLTLFHVIAGVGELTVDDYSLTTQSGTTTDTTAPQVTVTSPVGGSVLSGMSGINVSASDSSGVDSVEFYIDGVLSFTGHTAPYTFNWNTTGVVNGNHTIFAKATDTFGNSANSTSITVNVNNSTTTPPTTGNNLILNPGLETLGANGNPTGWSRGGWGTNNRTYTYPVAGATGNAAQVDISSYTNGDVKWYFTPVTVTPGEQYTFNYKYKASAPTNISLRYTLTNDTFQYVGITNPVASANWVNGTFTVVPPAGVKELTVMHILYQVGTLAVDDYSLSSASATTSSAFNRGKVSFSFDDGWLEHSAIAAPTLTSAGLDGTFYIVSNEMLGAVPTERLHNPTLDVAGANGNPVNWNRGGWGTNDRTFTYPVTGVTGSAAKLDVTSYTDGDAKWYFDDVEVLKNLRYNITGQYQATAPTEVLVRFQLENNAYQYQFVSSLPATNPGEWTSYNGYVITPATAKSLTVFHLLAGVGTLIIDDVSVKQQQVYANQDEVLAMQAMGHEIGAHTRTHTSLITLDTAGKTDEINGSKQALETAGLTINSIAYPYGDYNDEVKTIVANSGFALGRSVDRGFNIGSADPYALKIQQVGRNTTVADIEVWVEQAAQNKTWLILMFHQISDDLSQALGFTSSDFTELVNYTATANVDVITVAQGAALLD